MEEVPFFSASGDECPLPSKGAAGAAGSGGQVSLRPRVRVRETERKKHINSLVPMNVLAQTN